MPDPRQPFSITHPHARQAMLFVHGFMGNPSQFDALAQAVYARGFDVHALLLPGHGSTRDAFLRSKRSQWQVAVDAAIAAYQTQYERLYLCGHSMGGTLLLHADLTHPALAGLILLVPPLKIRFPRKSALQKGGFLPHKSEQQSLFKRICRQFVSVCRLAPRFFELLRLGQSARTKLRRVRMPVVCMCSDADQFVNGEKSSVVFEKNTAHLSLRKSLFTHAPHQACIDPEKNPSLLPAIDEFVEQTRG